MTGWTREQGALLAEMWLCGMTSVDIASVTGRTRAAVMGRVNRTGLMKRQGEGVMPKGTPVQQVALGIAITFPDITGMNRTPSRKDDVASVILAMVADGRRSRRIHSITGLPREVVRDVADALESSGKWPRKGGPEVAWWAHGAGAFRQTVDAVSQVLHGSMAQAA